MVAESQRHEHTHTHTQFVVHVARALWDVSPHVACTWGNVLWMLEAANKITTTNIGRHIFDVCCAFAPTLSIKWLHTILCIWLNGVRLLCTFRFRLAIDLVFTQIAFRHEKWGAGANTFELGGLPSCDESEFDGIDGMESRKLGNNFHQQIETHTHTHTHSEQKKTNTHRNLFWILRNVRTCWYDL